MNKLLKVQERRLKKTEQEISLIRLLNGQRERLQNVQKHSEIKPSTHVMKSSSNRSSRERIKVYDVFSNIPRNRSQSHHCRKIDDSREIIQKLQLQQAKPRASEPPQKMSGKSSINLKAELKKTSKFFEPQGQSNPLELTCHKKRSISHLPPKPCLFKENDNSISYIRPLQEPKVKRVKINIKKFKDENILDLLLLNTMELKQKINSHRCNSSFICVRPGKLPKDFFNQ